MPIDSGKNDIISFLRKSYNKLNEPVALFATKLYDGLISKEYRNSANVKVTNDIFLTTKRNSTAELKICLNGFNCKTNGDCILGSICTTDIDPSASGGTCAYDESFDSLKSNTTCSIRNEKCSPTSGCCNPSLHCKSTSNMCIPILPPACVLSKFDGIFSQNSSTSSNKVSATFSNMIPLDSMTSLFLMNGLFLFLIVTSCFVYLWRIKRHRKIPKTPVEQQTVRRYDRAGRWLPGEAPPYALCHIVSMDGGQGSSVPTYLGCSQATLSFSTMDEVQDTSFSVGRGVSGNFLEEDDFYSLVYPDEEKSTTVSYDCDLEDDSDSDRRAAGSDRSKMRRRMLLNGPWGSETGQPLGSEDGSVFIIMQAEMDDQEDDVCREEKGDNFTAIV